MIYVALLRGINVGGKTKVEMAKLKVTFEQLGFEHVKTYINSGNVIFESESTDAAKLVKQIETAITRDFNLAVPILLRSQPEIKKLVKAIPDNWVNNSAMKCDVMFLQPEIDKPKILEQIPHNPDIEDVAYYPGAVVWRIDRDKVARGKVLKIIGSEVHKKLTVRNPNTVRKLCEMMQTV